ncbi:putative efflux pump outer membrane protein TtgC precursor [Pseudovibrio sp. Ad37]|nr:putative efflux pump outer membrane protein TtgC precursor [Pseudovibrio sp. Ad26]KZL22273.1 putative efflux pump outer membrane protein TtgC precursor [Pseudovibrio sp. WM33]KZL27709.1 putative efflux pump outer membrane protein TtgC precursor [Pseudovibrio sp. Ad37]
MSVWFGFCSKTRSSPAPTVRRRSSLMLFFLLSACMVGPDFKRPELSPEAKFTRNDPGATVSADIQGGASQSFSTQRDLPGEWWELFESNALNTYVSLAVANSPTIAQAEANLRQAQENAYVAGAGLYPTVTGNASRNRQKFPIGGGGASEIVANLNPFFTTYSLSLAISYTLDVWGGTRRNIESQVANIQYSQFQVEAAHLTLTSNLLNAVILEASLRGQIRATEEIIKAQQRQLSILQAQFRLGGVDESQVLQQLATLEQTKATLPPLQQQLVVQKNQIKTLGGFYPTQDIVKEFDLSDLKLPRKLPLSLPSQLVARRPDIRSAEAQLWQASANIGVALANQLPSFQITGNVGNDSDVFNRLFFSGTGAWQITTSVAQTVFDAGALNSQRKAAVAAFESSAANYREVVLTAFGDTSNAVSALKNDARALKASLAAERSARKSLRLTQQQYNLGAIDLTTLLLAVQTYQQAKINLVQAQAARFTDTVALFFALGGGWWNRPNAAPIRDGRPLTIISAVPPFNRKQIQPVNQP